MFLLVYNNFIYMGLLVDTFFGATLLYMVFNLYMAIS
jgi:hypothetical protein